MICFQISIFAESYTPSSTYMYIGNLLWFAFKLVSLQSHIHQKKKREAMPPVVICFQISIFAESYTPMVREAAPVTVLWFAFKLVSLQSHIHPVSCLQIAFIVVICFQISIFAESYTPQTEISACLNWLWFAFKLVSLQSHIHRNNSKVKREYGCDLLSN